MQYCPQHILLNAHHAIWCRHGVPKHLRGCRNIVRHTGNLPQRAIQSIRQQLSPIMQAIQCHTRSLAAPQAAMRSVRVAPPALSAALHTWRTPALPHNMLPRIAAPSSRCVGSTQADETNTLSPPGLHRSARTLLAPLVAASASAKTTLLTRPGRP